MKKLLLISFIVSAAIYGCKKDTGTKVNITSADVAVINSELKGLWLFPVENQTINDLSGALLQQAGYVAAPALKFDGGSTVTVIDNTQVSTNSTYKVSTKDGLTYLDITDSKGTDVTYQVVQINNQTLQLLSKTPYTFYNNQNPEPAQIISTLTLKKQASADMTASLVTVEVISGQTYGVNVFETNTKGADTAKLLDSKQGVQGTYIFEFPAQSGIQLNADITADYSTSGFYAYYNGIPMSGIVRPSGSTEFKTTTGWLVP